MRLHQNSNGFSLVELMMVVSITSLLVTVFSASTSIWRAKAHQSQAIMYLRTMGASFTSYAIDNEEVYPSQDSMNPWFTTSHVTATSCYRSDNPIGLIIPDCRKLNYYLYYVPATPGQGMARMFARERMDGNQRLVFKHCAYVTPTQQQQQQQQQSQPLPGPLTEGGLFLQKLTLDTWLYSFMYQTYVKYPADNDPCKY